MINSNKNSKIEELYKNLSKIEKEGITSFLECSLFNQSKILVGIHLYLVDNCNATDSSLDKEKLYRAIFPKNEKYSDGKLRVFFSKLVKLIEKFLIVKNIDQYPLAELTILNQYYSKNHLHKNYTVFFSSKSEIVFESYEEYLMYEYAYAMRKLDFVHQENANDSDKIRENFEFVLNSQKKLSFFQTLKTQCDYLSYSQKYKTERDSSYEENIVKQLIDSRDEQDEVIQAYIYVYLLSKENNENYLARLKELIISGSIQFVANYRALLSHTENFCIRFINSGKSEYLQHLFELYNLEIQFFKITGDLNAATFRNIVYTALQLNQIDWAENFVENYYTKVAEQDQQNNYNFNYARIYFEKRDYKSAMRQLLKVNYEHPAYASMGRILLIKCYYELNDEMPLISCCGSLNQFLLRSKEFTKQRIENNLHFIKYVKILQKHRLKRDRKYFKQLYDKINQTTVVDKEWLLRKINELI